MMWSMRLRRSAVALTVMACTAAPLAACGSDDESGEDDGVTVLASFYPLAFVAERIGGAHVTVDNLTQPGVESHHLELSAQQVGSVAEADFVVYQRGYQPSVDDAVEQNAEGEVLDTSDLYPLLEEKPGNYDQLDGDPHVWLDPNNMQQIASEVADQLAQIDPANADEYADNMFALDTELRKLDEAYETTLDQCQRNTFVVAHEAFGHMAHRYDLHQVGIGGLDPESEPSPERIAEVHDIVRTEGVDTIFYEPLVSPKAAETVAADLGIESAVLDPIEGRTDETADEDYLTLMRSNLEALRTANRCG